MWWRRGQSLFLALAKDSSWWSHLEDGSSFSNGSRISRSLSVFSSCSTWKHCSRSHHCCHTDSSSCAPKTFCGAAWRGFCCLKVKSRLCDLTTSRETLTGSWISSHLTIKLLPSTRSKRSNTSLLPPAAQASMPLTSLAYRLWLASALGLGYRRIGIVMITWQSSSL
jgi:hypothetical protein